MCSAFSFDVSIFSELLIVLQVRCFTGFHLGRDGYIHLSSKVDGFVSICMCILHAVVTFVLGVGKKWGWGLVGILKKFETSTVLSLELLGQILSQIGSKQNSHLRLPPTTFVQTFKNY